MGRKGTRLDRCAGKAADCRAPQLGKGDVEARGERLAAVRVHRLVLVGERPEHCRHTAVGHRNQARSVGDSGDLARVRNPPAQFEESAVGAELAEFSTRAPLHEI